MSRPRPSNTGRFVDVASGQGKKRSNIFSTESSTGRWYLETGKQGGLKDFGGCFISRLLFQKHFRTFPPQPQSVKQSTDDQQLPRSLPSGNVLSTTAGIQAAHESSTSHFRTFSDPTFLRLLTAILYFYHCSLSTGRKPHIQIEIHDNRAVVVLLKQAANTEPSSNDIQRSCLT